MASIQHSLLKMNNVRHVFDVICKNRPCSRYELSEQTQLSLPSITRILTTLESMGLIKESASVNDGLGRKTILIDVVPNIKLTAGIHIEKDFIRIGIVNIVNEIVASVERGCEPSKLSAKETIGEAAMMLEQLIKETGIYPTHLTGVGIALPGIVDNEKGILHFSPQLMWQDLPIKNIAQEKFRCPVFVDNDINYFAIGENTNWPGEKPHSVAVLSVGSGVGAALINENAIFRGAFNMTGEIGHAKMEVGGRLCDCGRIGCLQTHMTQSAIINKAQEINPRIKTVKEVMDYMVQGAFWATSIIHDLVNYTSIAIGLLVSLYDPEVVIVGGDIIDHHEAILEKIVQRYYDTEYDVVRSSCKIITSRLKKHSVWYGAATAAMTTYISDSCFASLET